MRQKILVSVLLLAFIAVMVTFAFILVISPNISAANTNGSNYKNVTVWTHVNITNAKPQVLAVVVYQESNSSRSSITLSAGMTRTVTCNATIRDWNGFSDVTSGGIVNATLWYNTTSSNGAANDNNTHYTLASCTDGGNGASYTVNYLCSFNVYYYANNGTWNCNVTAYDNARANTSLNNYTTILPFYALNVTDGIDYGNVAVEDYSANVTANVTNFGNMAINVTVQGWGATKGDNLAMNCSLGGNITIDNEHFSTSDVAWESMTALTGSTQLINGLTISKQTVAGTPAVNATYWQLLVSSVNNPGGNCTGYILFSAETP